MTDERLTELLGQAIDVFKQAIESEVLEAVRVAEAVRKNTEEHSVDANGDCKPGCVKCFLAREQANRLAGIRARARTSPKCSECNAAGVALDAMRKERDALGVEVVALRRNLKLAAEWRARWTGDDAAEMLAATKEFLEHYRQQYAVESLDEDGP